ncbi:MAG: aspartate/glutamate racemase family protein [Rubrivivax sp.]
MSRKPGPMLGLLMLDTRFSRPPGDIGHPQTFGFAVRRRVVAGATATRVVRDRDPAVLAPFIRVARALVTEGCEAIATSCGFLSLWQRELQSALPVPVWTSSLLELARLQSGSQSQSQSQAPRARCGVITIDAASLTADHLRAVGADPLTPVEGIEVGSALHRTLLDDLPTLDMDDAAAQVLAAAARLRKRHPDIDTLVLECTNLPPYAEALRHQTGLHVHDVVTMLNARVAGLRP